MKKQGIKKYELRSRIITTIVVALIGMIFVLPLIWMISASLLTDAQVYEYPFQWLPAAPRWQNYREIYTSSIVSLPRMYLNSLTIAVASIAGVLLISALAAYAFACISFPGKNIVFALFIGVMMIPTQVTIIPRFLLFKTIGIYNTLWSVILPSFFSVTSIFLMRQFFMSLPVSLRESAFLDGAGHLRILMQIVFPLAKPTIASLIIINFITSWNDYFSPLIFLINNKMFTVSLGIRYYHTLEIPSTHLTMAMSVCAIMPILIVFFSCQRFFIESIATSGVKG